MKTHTNCNWMRLSKIYKNYFVAIHCSIYLHSLSLYQSLRQMKDIVDTAEGTQLLPLFHRVCYNAYHASLAAAKILSSSKGEEKADEIMVSCL